MQYPIVHAVFGFYGSDYEIFEGFGDTEVIAFEDELVLGREKNCCRLNLEGLELDSPGASGLPVLALRSDFDGEDGVRAELGLQEGQELVGCSCIGYV